MKTTFTTLACVALAAAPVYAQSNDADAEFKRGKTLMAQGKLAEACAAFDHSQELEANVSTMLNQANCREKNNQLATALTLFREAAIATERATDAKTVQFHNVASQREAKLGARVSTVAIDVPAPARVPGLTITRDGVAVDPARWGTELPVDGGTHVFEVSAPDHMPWKTTITVANEKDRKTLSVPVLLAVAKPVDTKPVDTKPVDTTPVDSKPDDTKPVDTTLDDAKPVDPNRDRIPVDTAPVDTSPEPGASRRSHTLSYALGGGGIALILGGIGLTVWATDAYEDAKKTGNDDRQNSLWRSANRRLYVAEAFGVAGVLAIGTAVVLRFRGGDRGPQLSAAVDANHAGLVVSGWF